MEEVERMRLFTKAFPPDALALFVDGVSVALKGVANINPVPSTPTKSLNSC